MNFCRRRQQIRWMAKRDVDGSSAMQPRWKMGERREATHSNSMSNVREIPVRRVRRDPIIHLFLPPPSSSHTLFTILIIAHRVTGFHRISTHKKHFLLLLKWFSGVISAKFPSQSKTNRRWRGERDAILARLICRKKKHPSLIETWELLLAH